MTFICLGEIVSAHGIKGQVKIKTYTQYPENIMSYGALITQNPSYETLTIKTLRASSVSSVIATLETIADRNAAEKLIGIKLYILRQQLPKTNGDEYYHHDLIGLLAYDVNDKEYGQVMGLEDYGAGIFLTLKPSAGTKMATLPFTQDAVLAIDLEAKKIILNPDFFLI